MAIGAFDAVQFDEIDFVVRKLIALVDLMTRLSADLTFLAVLRWNLGLLDNIAGGRLRRVALVLLGGGEFSLQLRNLALELFKVLLQIGASCARLRRCNGHNAIG